MTDIEMLRRVRASRALLQIDSEILWALERIRAYFDGRPLKTFLELGCHTGASLCIWSQLLAKDGVLIGVSPSSDQHSQRLVRYVEEITGKKLYYIKGLSEDPNSLKSVEQILDGKSLDAIFIDTIHKALQTRKEWEIYSPLMGERGVIGFHDIVTDLVIDGEPGTGDFWHTLKRRYSYEEKHSAPHDEHFGIGLLFL